MRAALALVVAVGLLAGCSDSEPEVVDSSAEAASEESFCEVAEDYLTLQMMAAELSVSEDGDNAGALRDFWTAAREGAVELADVAPEDVSSDAQTIEMIVSEYDDALGAIDYEIDRLVTDDDPALIERFRDIDLQASAAAGQRIGEFYAVACGELPGGEIELEPVPLDPPA